MTDPTGDLSKMYIRASILSGMSWDINIGGEPILSSEVQEAMRIALKVLGKPTPDSWIIDRVAWLKKQGFREEAEQYESFLDCID